MFEETYASVTTNVAGREIKLETGKIATSHSIYHCFFWR